MKKKKGIKKTSCSFKKNTYSLDDMLIITNFFAKQEGSVRESIGYNRGYAKAKEIAFKLYLVSTIAFLISSLFLIFIVKTSKNDIKKFEDQNLKLEEPLKLYNVGVGSNLPCFK